MRRNKARAEAAGASSASSLALTAAVRSSLLAAKLAASSADGQQQQVVYPTRAAASDTVADVVRLELIGRGSFGRVYKGMKTLTGEIVAIKALKLDTDSDDFEDMRKEIEALSKCDSEHIVKYHGSYLNRTELWIILDYCSGGSVRSLLKSGPIAEKYIQIIAREVLKGLAYLHKNHIIHRDIKAANILLTSEGQVKLCDFGVSGAVSMHTVRRNSIVGTPYWMAPEIIKSDPHDNKADIWSFGITIYEIATGNPPFAELEPMKALFEIPKSSPPRLSEQHFPKAMCELVAQCLNDAPRERPTAEMLLKTKFIQSAKKTKELIELIVRHVEWKASGNDEGSDGDVNFDSDSDAEEAEGETAKKTSQAKAAPDVTWDFNTIKSIDIRTLQRSSSSKKSESETKAEQEQPTTTNESSSNGKSNAKVPAPAGPSSQTSEPNRVLDVVTSKTSWEEDLKSPDDSENPRGGRPYEEGNGGSSASPRTPSPFKRVADDADHTSGLDECSDLHVSDVSIVEQGNLMFEDPALAEIMRANADRLPAHGANPRQPRKHLGSEPGLNSVLDGTGTSGADTDSSPSLSASSSRTSSLSVSTTSTNINSASSSSTSGGMTVVGATSASSSNPSGMNPAAAAAVALVATTSSNVISGSAVKMNRLRPSSVIMTVSTDRENNVSRNSSPKSSQPASPQPWENAEAIRSRLSSRSSHSSDLAGSDSGSMQRRPSSRSSFSSDLSDISEAMSPSGASALTSNANNNHDVNDYNNNNNQSGNQRINNQPSSNQGAFPMDPGRRMKERVSWQADAITSDLTESTISSPDDDSRTDSPESTIDSELASSHDAARKAASRKWLGGGDDLRDSDANKNNSNNNASNNNDNNNNNLSDRNVSLTNQSYSLSKSASEPSRTPTSFMSSSMTPSLAGAASGLPKPSGLVIPQATLSPLNAPNDTSMSSARTPSSPSSPSTSITASTPSTVSDNISAAGSTNSMSSREQLPLSGMAAAPTATLAAESADFKSQRGASSQGHSAASPSPSVSAVGGTTTAAAAASRTNNSSSVGGNIGDISSGGQNKIALDLQQRGGAGGGGNSSEQPRQGPANIANLSPNNHRSSSLQSISNGRVRSTSETIDRFVVSDVNAPANAVGGLGVAGGIGGHMELPSSTYLMVPKGASTRSPSFEGISSLSRSNGNMNANSFSNGVGSMHVNTGANFAVSGAGGGGGGGVASVSSFSPSSAILRSAASKTPPNASTAGALSSSFYSSTRHAQLQTQTQTQPNLSVASQQPSSLQVQTSTLQRGQQQQQPPQQDQQQQQQQQQQETTPLDPDPSELLPFRPRQIRSRTPTMTVAGDYPSHSYHTPAARRMYGTLITTGSAGGFGVGPGPSGAPPEGSNFDESVRLQQQPQQGNIGNSNQLFLQAHHHVHQSGARSRSVNAGSPSLAGTVSSFVGVASPGGVGFNNSTNNNNNININNNVNNNSQSQLAHTHRLQQGSSTTAAQSAIYPAAGSNLVGSVGIALSPHATFGGYNSIHTPGSPGFIRAPWRQGRNISGSLSASITASASASASAALGPQTTSSLNQASARSPSPDQSAISGAYAVPSSPANVLAWGGEAGQQQQQQQQDSPIAKEHARAPGARPAQSEVPSPTHAMSSSPSSSSSSSPLPSVGSGLANSPRATIHHIPSPLAGLSGGVGNSGHSGSVTTPTSASSCRTSQGYARSRTASHQSFDREREELFERLSSLNEEAMRLLSTFESLIRQVTD